MVQIPKTIPLTWKVLKRHLLNAVRLSVGFNDYRHSSYYSISNHPNFTFEKSEILMEICLFNLWNFEKSSCFFFISFQLFRLRNELFDFFFPTQVFPIYFKMYQIYTDSPSWGWEYLENTCGQETQAQPTHQNWLSWAQRWSFLALYILPETGNS